MYIAVATRHILIWLGTIIHIHNLKHMKQCDPQSWAYKNGKKKKKSHCYVLFTHFAGSKRRSRRYHKNITDS